jgi:acetolactate synthase-1/2/3 large subunit
MPHMTGARYLAETLAAYDVSHVFWVPAVLNLTLAELEKRTGVQRVMTHGEKAAVYMADGYARASGRPGVCFAQCVGAANLAAALQDPLLARSPIVAITGGPDAQGRDRSVYQQVDALALLKTMTKFSARVEDVGRLPDALRQAFRAATTGAPGPAHIELAGHLGELETAEADLDTRCEPHFSKVPAVRSAAEGAAVAAAARRLEGAQRPVIVAGGGVRWSGAGPALVRLAETLAIPVATSLNAKDTIGGLHPLNVGVPGLYCRHSANWLLREADLVFFVGSGTGSQVTFNWQVPPPGTPVIQLDIDGAELGRHYPNEVSLLGDARLVLEQLLDEVDGSSATTRQDWLRRADDMAGAWRKRHEADLNSDAAPILPQRLCRQLSEWLPEGALLVSETGHSGMWTGGMVDLNKPAQGYIRAAGSLGWGLPAALGAALACPGRPVVLFSGDGGFWYHLAEIETAVRWNIPAVLVVNNNLSLNQEIDLTKDAYGGELSGRHGELWQFTDASFAKIAEAMGAAGVRVEEPDQLPAALDEALASKRPYVVEVMTEMSMMAPVATLEP